ncbi:MAG: hypothetical protein GF317_05995 [Candidatus Lokiarchaeota archaeon]|nr:hypothetical protein [Candidatus Lokiarchaeota archaeon]
MESLYKKKKDDKEETTTNSNIKPIKINLSDLEIDQTDTLEDSEKEIVIKETEVINKKPENKKKDRREEEEKKEKEEEEEENGDDDDKDRDDTPKEMEMYIGKYYDTYPRGDTIDFVKLTDKKVSIRKDKPQITIIGGRRGSGKSYCMNVIIEEFLKTMNQKDPNKNLLVLDNMGLYYSMIKPNIVKNELKDWADISPYGFRKYIKIYIPAGLKDKYNKRTYDELLYLKPSELTENVWWDLFQIEPATAQGTLLRRIMHETIQVRKIKNFSIDDLIESLNELERRGKASGQKDVHHGTAASLRNKFRSMQSWGIFDTQKGINIHDLCEPGKCIIIDVFEAEEKSIAAFLVSFLADKIYKVRKQLCAHAAHEKLGIVEKSNTEYFPRVILTIEEAHQFLPSGGKKTYILKALERFTKLGRAAQLSLFLVTQEPGELDTKILKQFDYLFIHKLTHKKDIDAVVEISGREFTDAEINTIRQLKPGRAFLVATGEEESGFIRVRARHSYHVDRTEGFEKRKKGQEKHLNIPEISIEDLEKLNKLKEKEKELKKTHKRIEELQHKINILTAHDYKAKFEETKSKLIKIKEEKNKALNKVKKCQQEIDEMKTNVSSIIEITPKTNSGVILGYFDEDNGYIPKFYQTIIEKENLNENDKKLINKITMAALGVNNTKDLYKLEINEYPGKIFARQFSISQDLDDDNGDIDNNIDNEEQDLFGLIFYSTDPNFRISKSQMNTYIDDIIQSETPNKIIDNIYEENFRKVIESGSMSKAEISNLEHKYKDLQSEHRKLLKTKEELEEEMTILREENKLLEQIRDEYKTQLKSTPKDKKEVINSEIRRLNLIIGAKENMIDNQVKTVIRLQNKLNTKNKIIKKYEELEKIKPPTVTNISVNTERVAEQQQLEDEEEEEDQQQEYKEEALPDIPAEEKIGVIDEVKEIKKVNYRKAWLQPYINEGLKIIKKKINSLDPKCFRILSLIESYEQKEISTGELAEQIDMIKRKSIIKHIKKHLRKKGFVLIRKRGSGYVYESRIKYLMQDVFEDCLAHLKKNEIMKIYLDVRNMLDLT